MSRSSVWGEGQEEELQMEQSLPRLHCPPPRTFPAAFEGRDLPPASLPPESLQLRRWLAGRKLLAAEGRLEGGSQRVLWRWAGQGRQGARGLESAGRRASSFSAKPGGAGGGPSTQRGAWPDPASPEPPFQAR